MDWASGDGKEHGDDDAWDAAEAGALYDLLEREVVPEFYQRDKDGIPAGWVARMQESMARSTLAFPPAAGYANISRNIISLPWLPIASARQIQAP